MEDLRYFYSTVAKAESQLGQMKFLCKSYKGLSFVSLPSHNRLIQGWSGAVATSAQRSQARRSGSR